MTILENYSYEFDRGLGAVTGSAACLTLIVGICINVIHSLMTMKSPTRDNKDARALLKFSHPSMIGMTLSALFAVLAYFAPQTSNHTCLCKYYWIGLLVSYVTAVYCLKLMYVERVKILISPLENAESLQFKAKVYEV